MKVEGRRGEGKRKGMGNRTRGGGEGREESRGGKGR